MLVNGTKARQGSLRRLGQGGYPESMLSPGTTGRTSRDGCLREDDTHTFAVPFAGRGSEVDQIGWVPFGALIVTRMREPFR
jgi:hypothetical protein